MKLLMISTDRRIFDKGSAVAQRQIEYAKRYEEVHIIVFSNKDYMETTIGQNIWVYPTRSWNRWMYIFDALSLARFITEKRGITHVTCQDPFETGLVGSLVKNRHDVKLELQVHTDIGSIYFQKFTILNRIRTRISKYTLARADHVRVVSERIKNYVARSVDVSKIEVRPIAIDTSIFQSSATPIDLHKKYPQFSKIILMVSRLEREKNISLALESFKIVLDKIPTVGLVIVGTGNELEYLKQLAVQLRIDKSVIFEGWQDNTTSYYKTADCFLNTSWYEGYGMTLVEAQSARLPIVSTDVGVAREVGAIIVGFEKNNIVRGIEEVIS